MRLLTHHREPVQKVAKLAALSLHARPLYVLREGGADLSVAVRSLRELAHAACLALALAALL